MNALAAAPWRGPTNHDGTSRHSAQIAIQVHVSPSPHTPFNSRGTFLAFMAVNAHISST